MADRQGFIDSAVKEFGLTSKQLNSALKEAGFEQLNKIETSLIDSGKWSTTLGERAVGGLKDITSGLSTLLSQTALHPIQTAKEAGAYLSSHSLPQIAGDFYDIAMKPVQLDSESLGRNFSEGGLSGVVEGAIAGAYTNPTDALLLTAPAWGKGLSKGVKTLAKNTDKLPIPQWSKDALRGAVSDAGREVNQILRDSKLVSAPEIENLRASNIKLQNAKTSDLSQAIRNLERGVQEGTVEQIELTNQLKNMTSKIDEMMVKAGFNPEYSRAETINQYVTRYFQDQGKHIPVSQVEKILNDTDLAKKYGVTIEEVQQALANGDRLYRDGFIRPIKHKSTATSTREGFVSEAEKKVRDPNAKMYGTQSYEDVAEGIKSGAYDNIIKTLEKSESSMSALDQMNNLVGRGVRSLDEIANLAKDEVVISPKLLREKMGTALAGGENVNEPLQSLTRGLNKAEMERYADNLYIYKKNDLEALQRAFNVSGKAGQLPGAGIANVGKSIALATPRYVIGNATTNFLMNPITGTHFGHYIKALDSIVNKTSDIPEVLKRSASYSGYLGDSLPIRANMKTIYEKLMKDLKEGDFTTKWQAMNSLVNTPIFKSSNMIETIQRSAEYINQAERYARQVGKTIDEVLKEASANNGLNKTYRAINRRVEEVLGDYTGRNYYAPEQMTAFANTMMPFYRPFTQAPRQMFNAIKDYPLGTQVGAVVPSRYGKAISDIAQEEYGIQPYESQGGAPVLAPDATAPGRVLYNQYHPFSPVGETFNNPMEVLQGNPFLGSIYNIGAGRTRYGQVPLPPNTYRLSDGSLAVMDNNGNVKPYIPENNQADVWKFRVAEALKTFTPVSGVNSYILPALALATHSEYVRPADTSIFGQIGDVSIPNIMEGATGRTRSGFREITLPQLGFNYADTYPERSEEYTPVQVRTTRKKILKKQARSERR